MHRVKAQSDAFVRDGGNGRCGRIQRSGHLALILGVKNDTAGIKRIRIIDAVAACSDAHHVPPCRKRGGDRHRNFLRYGVLCAVDFHDVPIRVSARPPFDIVSVLLFFGQDGKVCGRGVRDREGDRIVKRRSVVKPVVADQAHRKGNLATQKQRLVSHPRLGGIRRDGDKRNGRIVLIDLVRNGVGGITVAPFDHPFRCVEGKIHLSKALQGRFAVLHRDHIRRADRAGGVRNAVPKRLHRDLKAAVLGKGKVVIRGILGRQITLSVKIDLVTVVVQNRAPHHAIARHGDARRGKLRQSGLGRATLVNDGLGISARAVVSGDAHRDLVLLGIGDRKAELVFLRRIDVVVNFYVVRNRADDGVPRQNVVVNGKILGHGNIALLLPARYKKQKDHGNNDQYEQKRFSFHRHL